MSRTSRFDYFKPQPKRRYTMKEVMGRLYREVKRRMIAGGELLVSKAKYTWQWELGTVGGKVAANTKSEARALIKKELGIPKKGRLPVSIQIERFYADS